jgi:hypothetical protein
LVSTSLEKRTFEATRRKWENFNIGIKEILTGFNWLHIAGFLAVTGKIVNFSDVRFISK